MRLRFPTTIAAVIAALACAAFAQQPPVAPVPPGGGSRNAPAIATVGPVRITQAEYDSRVGGAMEQYRARLGSEVPAGLKPVVRRQVLEGFIRRGLLGLEAERRGIVASPAEAEAELKRDAFFQKDGVFNEAKFLALKSGQPAAFQSALDVTRRHLAARRLNQQLEIEKAEPAAVLRARTERALTRASVGFLGIRRAEFSGAYAEPRESEVLAYYRSHAEDFRRPDRASLSVAFIDTPALPESLSGDPAAVRAWNARMRQRADSVLAQVRAGASLDDAAAAFGALRKNVVVTRDNFPGFWSGDERLNGLVFLQAPGMVLPEPVPARAGWLLARVDEVLTAHVAPLSEVAREIRGRLRGGARARDDERAQRVLYDQLRDSLRTTAYRVRYAVVDAARIKSAEPKTADLDRYYHAHIADYSRYDPATASVRVRPLAEVADDVRERWRRDRRHALARDLVARLESAWRRGARDRALEGSVTLLREIGPVALGAPADTGAAGAALTDSLAARGGAPGVGVCTTPGGMMVFHVFESVPNFLPDFDQARPQLERRLKLQRDLEDEQNARVLFDQDPRRFVGGSVIHFTRLLVPEPELIQVPLTREEVERYHLEHIDKYSAPEQMRARHILVSPAGPGPTADSAARAKAEDLLRRVRAGEDFGELAKRYSEDPATVEKGGDLGLFGRGAMLEGFERAAFALKPGEVTDLVKTEVGYHIIKCLEREGAVAQPLEWIYGNVGGDAAHDKASLIARRRADSLYLARRTPAALRAAAGAAGIQLEEFEHEVGNRRAAPDMITVLERLENSKPGQMYPGSYAIPGVGWALSWVDTVTPPPTPRWGAAKARALSMWRQGAGDRGLDAKCAELDSMLASGWSLDSLAALWGGLQEEGALAPGRGLPGLGGGAVLDSLIFGSSKPPVLQPGQVTDWIKLASGVARVRLERRLPPVATQLASRMENDRRARIDRQLFAYFEGLKRRYPVRILDPVLRDVALPEPPPE